MKIKTSVHSQRCLHWPLLIVFASSGFALFGCSLERAPFMSPQGPIAVSQNELFFTALALMMVVVVPVFVMTGWFAWRYRASNDGAKYEPEWDESRLVDLLIWGVPAILVLALAAMVWQATHELDPYRPISTNAEPLEVQVIAQDWKWLFVYPQYGVAAVNELAFPVEQPIKLRITSDTVMNALFIPALGGQIYAMAGMESQLNLQASNTGRFFGRNTQYSGDGFSDQEFHAIAMTNEEFSVWVENVRDSSSDLSLSAYAELRAPSTAHPVTYYKNVDPELFTDVMSKYMAHPPLESK
ncbi:MAG: ubiquinol oxidase subunit II [Pseudomonadales bacterium]